MTSGAAWNIFIYSSIGSSFNPSESYWLMKPPGSGAKNKTI